MKIDELYKIGFKDEITNKPNGIVEYYLREEREDEVFLQVCVLNTDIYPTLIVNQYDWGEMEGNLTRLPMINIRDIETLKKEIETLKRLFVV